MQVVQISSHQSPVHKLGHSEMTLPPKFRLSAVSSLLLDTELAHSGEPLIPGLPDDVSFNCLLRVPLNSHAVCRAVSKRWYSLFCNNKRFFSRRKEFSFHDPWLFVSAYDKCSEKIQWKVFDLNNFAWHVAPAMPCKETVGPNGFRCAAMAHEGVAFVCGGVVPEVDQPLNLVMKYELQSNSWTMMKRMITVRSCFGIGVIDGVVYVAGGNSKELFELKSGEAMDPRSGMWQPIAKMGINMATFDAAVLNGKLFVTEGWLWPFYVLPRGQIYDPRTDHWERMPSGLREGWTGSSVVIDGCLFVVPDLERINVKVYDFDSDSWEMVEGPPLPDEICRPFCVDSCDNRIIIVGRDLHVVVGRVTRQLQSESSEKKFKFVVKWQVIDAVETFSDLTPSSAQVLFA